MFSIMLAIILGCCTWLLLGDKFPLSEAQKWPALNNIVCYAAIILVPVYLFIFFTF